MSTRNVILITAALAAVMLFATAALISEPERPDAPPAPASQPSGEPRPAGDGDETLQADTSGEEAAPLAQMDPREEFQARQEALDRDRIREQIREELSHHLDHPGNLQKFFDRLDRLCAGVEDCDELLEDVLDDVDPEMAAMIRRIQERLPAYEEQMQQTRMSMDLSGRERFDRIQQLRAEMLGAEEAELMFGQERAFADYRFELNELGQQASQMAPEQRREALEQLRQDAFGEYAESLDQEEGTFGRYRAELNLMLEGVENEHQRQRITREVRERHLDEETIERMERRDDQKRQQEQEVASYQERVEQLEAEMETLRETMPEDEWEQEYRERMTELRREHFD